MHPYHHSLSSVQRWGGCVSDYMPVHNWFDASKEHMPDIRHRAMRHHAEGIFECERVFGVTIKNSDGKLVPVRFIGEQHVMEDCGRIPTIKDWLRCIAVEPWMLKVAVKAGDKPMRRKKERIVKSFKIPEGMRSLEQLRAEEAKARRKKPK